MAKVIVTNNILEGNSVTNTIESCETIRDVIDKYSGNDEYNGVYVECYDCDTDETTYVPIESDTDKLSVIVTINGKDALLEDKIQDEDLVELIIVPSGGDTVSVVVGAVVGATVGAIIGAIAGGPMGAVAGAFMGGIVGAGLGMVVSSMMKDVTTGSSSTKNLESEDRPGVRGASNPVLTGNSYPYVMGKHLITPFVVGSPYTVSTGDLGQDQYIHVLYCAGYSPLRLTDFKLGDLNLAHNKAWKGNTSLECVMDGTLKSGELVTDTWKNNDVTLEIHQQNPSATLNYGSAYNQAVIQQDISSTPLYVADNDLADVNVSYKGVLFANNYRNNSVRFTESCPMKISVELEAESGLYRTRTETDSNNNSSTVYKSLPVWYAIQWRFHSNLNESSNAESGSGWNSFGTLNPGTTHSVSPEEFTLAKCLTDVEAHEGNSLPYTDYGTTTLTDAQIQTAIAAGHLTKTKYSYNYHYTGTDECGRTVTLYSSGTDYSYVSNISNIAVTSVVENAAYLALQSGDVVHTIYTVTGTGGTTSVNSGWVGYQAFNLQNAWVSDDTKKNVSTMRFTTTYSLSLAECKQLLNDTSNPASMIDVRVIRISPGYTNQTTSTSKNSAWNYSDIVKWTTLTTYKFDEDKTNTASSVDDIILRPMTDEYLKKYCYIAFSAKADAGNNIQNQLKKMNCTAESFAPVYDSTNHVWFPSSVNQITKYYNPYTLDTSTNKWVIGSEITKSEYETARQAGTKAVRVRCGNDFTSQIKSLIYSNVDSSGRYYLPAKTSAINISKCNDNNTASILLLSLLGSQCGKDAVGYDFFNMQSVADLYQFSEKVTDGSTYSTTVVEYDDFGNSTTHASGTAVEIKMACNGYIYKPIKVDTLIQKILLTARSTYTRDDYGKLLVVIDKPVDNPVMIINQQNCLSGSNTISYADNPAGLQFSFEDENEDFATNTIYAMSDGESATSPRGDIEGYALDYVTNPYQMWSLGRYILANRILEKETLQRKVSAEGANLTIGDMVYVQDDTLLIGTDHGGRIQKVIQDSDFIYGIVTDELYEYTGEIDANNLSTQGVEILQPTQFKGSRVITLRMAIAGYYINVAETVKDRDLEETTQYVKYTQTVGQTNVALFNKRITKSGHYLEGSDSDIIYYLPQEDNIVAFGYVGSITSKYRVSKIKPDKDFNFDLTLVQYNENLYNYGKALPSLQNNMTLPDRSGEDSFNLDNSVTYSDLVNRFTENTIVYLGDLSAAPANPKKNQEYHNTTDGCTYIYDGSAWVIIAKDGATGASGTTYWMNVSADVIKSDANDVLYPSTITASGKKQTGTESIASYSAIYKIYLDGSSTPIVTTASVTSYTYTIPTGTTSIKISMCPPGDTTVEYDSQTIPVISEKTLYTILLTNTKQVFDSDENKKVAAKTVTTSVIGYEGTDPIIVQIGDVPNVSGFTIINHGASLDITALDTTGTTMADFGTIAIPVYIMYGDNADVVGDEEGYVIGDDNGNVVGEWNNITTTGKSYTVYFSYQKSTATISSELVASLTAAYKGFYTSSSDFPTEVKYGDWILYGGGNDGTYTYGCIYYYTGSGWALDTNADHNAGSYSINANATAFIQSRDGDITPNSITVSATKTMYNQTLAFTGRYIIYISTNGTDYTSIATSEGDESGHTCSLANTGALSIRVDLYASGGTTNKLATKDYSVTYAADCSPMYLGIGALSAVGTKAFTGATVSDSGVVTVGSTVSAIIKGDWMINYTGDVSTGLYKWSGSVWETTSEMTYVQATQFDVLNLHTGNITISDYEVMINAIIKNLMVENLQLKNKIYAGTGNYGNTDTPVFLGFDGDTAKFSLGDKLKYDGTNLSINGSGSFSGAVNATSGSFTGAVNATSGSFTGAVNANKLNLTGTGNVLDATNLKISSDGTMTATSGNFTGTVNATSGTFSGTVNAKGGTFSGSITATGCSFQRGGLSSFSLSGYTDISNTLFLNGNINDYTVNGNIDLYITSLSNLWSGCYDYFSGKARNIDDPSAGKFRCYGYISCNYSNIDSVTTIHYIVMTPSYIYFIGEDMAFRMGNGDSGIKYDSGGSFNSYCTRFNYLKVWF